MQPLLIRTAGSQPQLPVTFQPQVEVVEHPTVTPIVEPVPSSVFVQKTNRLPFIEANTKEVDLSHLREDCIIPVFSKDNEITISHQSFIETVHDAAKTVFPHEDIMDPSIRVSHIVKGRIPEAIHKPVKELLESDKTIYYERMMFCIEIPSICEDIDGNRLNLTIGGVRAYNEQNLYAKKSPEKFKIFIGFKNMVCCNLCISTDGYKSELKVMEQGSLFKFAVALFEGYNMVRHLNGMEALQNSYMSERQFAQFLGKSRLYQFLPKSEQKLLPQMLMTDTQIGMIARAYYHDENFSVSAGSQEISMWNVYNLLTGANKSSYIDNFLDRSLNVSLLSEGLARAIEGDSEYSWFIS